MRVLGLDPGTSTGWAMWDTERFQFIEVLALPIHKAMFQLHHMRIGGTGPDLIVMEDARLRKYFAKMDEKQKQYGAAIREGAGAAKRDAAIWDDYLTDLGIPFLKRKPMGTKRNAQEFQRLSNWIRPTNEHSRDAGMLVLQLNTPGANQMLAEARHKKGQFWRGNEDRDRCENCGRSYFAHTRDENGNWCPVETKERRSALDELDDDALNSALGGR